jgi:hypothetical protein
MNDKMKRLIETYDSIIYGNDEEIGFDMCYDTYYKGAWDERFEIVKQLKKELAIEDLAAKIWDNMESALSNQIHTRNPDEMKSLEEEIMDYSIEYKDHEDYNYIVGGVYRLYEKRFNELSPRH